MSDAPRDPNRPAVDLPDIPGYRVHRELGKGAMGVVYEAVRTCDDRPVALKVLPPGPTTSERSLARFRREGRILRRIDHPGLVRVHEQGDSGGLHWFAMELVRGTNLAERLQAGPLPIRQGAQLGIAAARALQAAHDHGVVHRDLKPGNVLLRDGPTAGEDLQIAISDFGLARDLDTGSVTESGALVGTPIYMAPEVILGHSDRDVPPTLADVYGLGATLYHAVTGHPPFSGPTAQSVLRAVVDRDPPPPTRLRRDLPTPFAAILAKAMARRPEDRYGAAAELAEDLERMLAGKRVRARLPGPGARLWRAIRQRPVGAALLGLTLVLAISSAILIREQRRESLLRELTEAESLLVQAVTAVDGTGQSAGPDARMKMLERAEFLVTRVLTRRPETLGGPGCCGRGSDCSCTVRWKRWGTWRKPWTGMGWTRWPLDCCAFRCCSGCPGAIPGRSSRRNCSACWPRTTAAPPDVRSQSTCWPSPPEPCRGWSRTRPWTRWPSCCPVSPRRTPRPPCSGPGWGSSGGI